MPVTSVTDSVFTQEGIDAILLSEVFASPSHANASTTTAGSW